MIPWRGLAVHKHELPSAHNGIARKSIEVTFVTGCMICVRCSALPTIGLQDERFFMYLDDIEYSARISKKGFTLLYVPEAVIYHRMDTAEESPFKLYYSVRNRFLLISTSFSSIEKLIAIMYSLSGYYFKVSSVVYFEARIIQGSIRRTL